MFSITMTNAKGQRVTGKFLKADEMAEFWEKNRPRKRRKRKSKENKG